MSKLVERDLGVGISYREQLKRFIYKNSDLIDVLEIIPEHFINSDQVHRVQELSDLNDKFEIVLHALSCNVVSATGPNKEYLSRLKELIRLTKSPYLSDHAAMTSVDGFPLGHLSPNLCSEETLSNSSINIRMIEDTLNVPLVLEYITYSTRISGSRWTPEEFYLELVNRNDQVGVLLDLANVWYNGNNFGFNPQKFIEALPQDRIVHIHLAGGKMENDRWIDSHSMPVHEEVFLLLEDIKRTADIDCLIIERDANYKEAVDDLAKDLKQAKYIMRHQNSNIPISSVTEKLHLASL